MPLRQGNREWPRSLRRSCPTAPARAESKLKILVSLDSDLQSARVVVHGTVTENNVAALYGILRRTNTFVPGMEILVDLGEAAAGPVVLDQLRTVTGEGRLPAAADPGRLPCRLRVLVPSGTPRPDRPRRQHRGRSAAVSDDFGNPSSV